MSQDRDGDGLAGGEVWVLGARPGPRGFVDTQVHGEGAGQARLLGVGGRTQALGWEGGWDCKPSLNIHGWRLPLWAVKMCVQVQDCPPRSIFLCQKVRQPLLLVQPTNAAKWRFVDPQQWALTTEPRGLYRAPLGRESPA